MRLLTINYPKKQTDITKIEEFVKKYQKINFPLVLRQMEELKFDELGHVLKKTNKEANICT